MKSGITRNLILGMADNDRRRSRSASCGVRVADFLMFGIELIFVYIDTHTAKR